MQLIPQPEYVQDLPSLTQADIALLDQLALEPVENGT